MMWWRSAVATLPLLGGAVPALAEPVAPTLQITLVRPQFPERLPFVATPFHDPAWQTAASARPAVSLSLTDRVGIVASGFKDKIPGERWVRPAEGPAGRARNPKRVARLGVFLNW